jgi:hypothetical protein
VSTAIVSPGTDNVKLIQETASAAAKTVCLPNVLPDDAVFKNTYKVLIIKDTKFGNFFFP